MCHNTKVATRLTRVAKIRNGIFRPWQKGACLWNGHPNTNIRFFLWKSLVILNWNQRRTSDVWWKNEWMGGHGWKTMRLLLRLQTIGTFFVRVIVLLLTNSTLSWNEIFIFNWALSFPFTHINTLHAHITSVTPTPSCAPHRILVYLINLLYILISEWNVGKCFIIKLLSCCSFSPPQHNFLSQTLGTQITNSEKSEHLSRSEVFLACEEGMCSCFSIYAQNKKKMFVCWKNFVFVRFSKTPKSHHPRRRTHWIFGENIPYERTGMCAYLNANAIRRAFSAFFGSTVHRQRNCDAPHG